MRANNALWPGAYPYLILSFCVVKLNMRIGPRNPGFVLALGFALVSGLASGARGEVESLKTVVNGYCMACHEGTSPKGGLNLSAVPTDSIEAHPEVWEKVIRRMRGKQMPPAGKDRPSDETYAAVVKELETTLDRAAAQRPNPGRTDTLRRLTRTEYQNAVRDLLAIEIDAAALLPADESSRGFDNITVGSLSPMLLDRYVTAAQKISRLAIGGADRAPGGDTIRIKPDVTQEDHVEGLPLGTRGGALIRYTFPREGEYEIQIRLTRDRNEEVEGLREPHELELMVDRGLIHTFTVNPPSAEMPHQRVDEHLQLRFSATAGPHDLGVTFVKNPSSLLETLRQPYTSRFNMHRHPRLGPAVYQVTITGPFADKGTGETPSRQRVLIAKPATADQEESCARQIVSSLMRRAYRRPVNSDDLDRVLPFYREARREGDFESGIESALAAILVSPEFLFRVEQDPAGIAPRTPYRISDLELATRLSFFLWSSIPDDELLGLAERGELRKPEILAQQTRRMLADARSASLVTSFANQWLHLRNLESITPDARLFPDFDDNLRQAMRRETELLFEEIIREDGSVLTLLETDHTWLNERLAKHYGIEGVYGPRFRRVELGKDAAEGQRGGLLRHGSVLTVTSYATRTSPVIRGKWILENLMGTPPPPPPADVPALDNTVSAGLPVRQRLEQHRANAACAGCHALIDPPGFALENFDAVGRWRTLEDGQPVDPSGGLPDGSQFSGVTGLEAALLKQPEIYVGTMTEKLLTYALGRVVEPFDAPAVREVVRTSKTANYRFSELITAIVKSTPFQMRSSS